MKDTILTLDRIHGKKNNLYYHSFINTNRFNNNLRLCSNHPQRLNRVVPSPLSLQGGVGGKNNYFLFRVTNQKLYYHISNIRAINRIGPHNEDILSVIIGSILGDAYASNRTGEGVRICYRQSIQHREYLFWLYTFYYSRGYCSNLPPRQYTRTLLNKAGKEYYGYEFNTFTFRSLSWVHKMFYKNGTKVIPLNISEYLTPLALAVWIMDDGGWVNCGVRIATNSFELKEVELLNSVIKSKYNLETTIQKIWIKDKYSIYIKKQSIIKLRSIVGPFIHSSMLYKIGSAPRPRGLDNTN
uniref:LAGLIDADG homing endonuclease n=1 Tax=Myochromella boudieri TaxID=117066 RepID=A0A386TY68_9AGAR|nr:LAGLIDADG homing endonuclease [Myochromella boudieri]AYE93142.1 LAGLIDADG homing endonuclease [Myochromella boudieri]